MLLFSDPGKLHEIAPSLFANSSNQTEQRVSIILPIVQFSHARRRAPLDEISATLPEELAYELRNRLNCLEVDDAVQSLRGGDKASVVAGGVLGIRGILKAELKPTRFHGEETLTAHLSMPPYQVAIRVPLDAQDQATHYDGQMLSAYGICRWIPPYRPGSGADIAVALRVVALFED